MSKRQEIENYVLKVISTLDKTGNNTKRYKEFFKQLGEDDTNFYNWLDSFLEDPKANFDIMCLPFEEPTAKDIKEAADVLNIDLDEYVYFKNDLDKDDPIRTRCKTPVGWVHIKRVQQMLSKKNKYTFNIENRDMKTGQLKADDKVARVSDQEDFALFAIGAVNAVKEFLGPRADDEIAKRDMYAKIKNDGYVSLNSLERVPGSSTTIRTIDAYLLAAGIKSDLITHDLRTKATLERNIKDISKK